MQNTPKLSTAIEVKSFKTYLTTFGNGKIRKVAVPVSELNGSIADLDRIYHHGQNCINPVEGCQSLSIGDIIECNNKKHLVNDYGFITEGDTSKNLGINVKIAMDFRSTTHPVHPMVEKHFGYLVPSENRMIQLSKGSDIKVGTIIEHKGWSAEVILTENGTTENHICITIKDGDDIGKTENISVPYESEVRIYNPSRYNK